MLLRISAMIVGMGKKKSKSKGSGHAATPAIAACEAAGINIKVHQFPHGDDNFGEEAAMWLNEHLGVEPERIFKTLIVELSGKKKGLAVSVVPVTGRMNLKAVAAALDASKAEMATPQAAINSTGYIPGGISPLGQKRRLPTVLDSSSATHERIFVSGGRRGWDIEIAPEDLVSLTSAVLYDVARD